MATEGKVAIVTGASAGIGKATAVTLLRAGWRVTLVGRRGELLDAAIADSGVPTSNALAIAADVGKADAVRALFDRTVDAFGRVDFLFNNAGMGAPAVPIEDLTLAQWQSVVDVNLTGAFLCTQQAFRVMKQQHPRGGRILNNGSISAHAPRPNSAPYTATKHAMTGLTRAAALDGRAFDIAVGQIDIGNAATEMTDRMAMGVPQANGTIAVEARMDVQHVADSVVQIANLPLETNVLFITIMATKMPFVGRG